MLSLLPPELYVSSINDSIRSLIAALKPIESRSAIRLPGLGDGIPIRSARASVIVALRALGMPSGSKIGVPLYCCPVVFKAIKAAACVPRFLDIDPETFCLSCEDLREKRSGIDALIAVYMFGNLCEMPRILEAMEGKPVIEDCAQSIGSKLGGRPCGSFGDVAIFSFRSGKYLSVGEGGALYSDRADLRARISELTNALPIPTRINEIKHVFMTYIKSKLRSRPLWGLVGSQIWDIYNKRTDFADKSPIALGQMYSSDYAIVHKRLASLDPMITTQRFYADYFERNLTVGPAMLYPEEPRTYSNRFMYPITFSSAEQRDFMATYLLDNGICTSKPYEEVIKGAAEYYGYEGDCPVAEKLLSRTLVIPINYKLSLHNIRHITERVNTAWAKIKKRE